MKNNLVRKDRFHTSTRQFEDLGISSKETRTTIEDINTTTKQLTYTEKDDEIPLTDHFDKLVPCQLGHKDGSFPQLLM